MTPAPARALDLSDEALGQYAIYIAECGLKGIYLENAAFKLLIALRDAAKAEQRPFKQFFDAFWDALCEQEFGYSDMDCEDLVTEKSVELGLVEAVPYDPDAHGEVAGDPEPGDTIYTLGAAAIRASGA